MVAVDPEVLSRNWLLAALPWEVRSRLGCLAEVRHLEEGVLVPSGGRWENVYFPLTAVVSLLTRTGPATVEAATIGHEGVAGASLLLGVEQLGDRELMAVQVPGRAVCLPGDVFRREAVTGTPLHQRTSRYLHAFLMQTARQVACNAVHSVRQRSARWLLLAHDRVGAEEFPLTQESLAQLLGVRRASVTEVAGAFQRAGFIRYRRGRVTIVDRAGLGSAACDCYSVIRAGFERLRGSGPDSTLADLAEPA